MTTFHRVLRSSVVVLGLTGCAQQQAADAPAVAPSVALAPQPAAPGDDPKSQPLAAPAIPPKPAFTFPADQAGAALARVVTPNVSQSLSEERLAVAPKPRTVSAKVLDPEAAERANTALTPVPLPNLAPIRPAVPAEKVPLDLGARADDPPAKPKLPVTPVVTTRARDANLPPPAPVLGRPFTERVSLDDPTSELGNAVIVSGAVKVPPAPSGFVKVTIPDPFELGEQVKPKVPATAEPSAAPVPVNPQRVK